MTEIIDEFFEHPFAKHDDLMDGLYYADWYAKPPLSGKVDKKDRNQNRAIQITFG